MNTIGFQNFRRFINFPEIVYGEITFLVGRNNSGKSTFVKALLLINDFFKSKNVNTFSFGNNVLEDANIVTYERAKNSFSKDNFIKFYYQVNDFEIGIIISGEHGKTVADVHSLSIKDIDEQIEFLFEPQIKTITIKKKNIQYSNKFESAISDLDSEILKLELAVEVNELKKSSKEYVELIDKLSSLKNKRNILAHGDISVSINDLEVVKESPSDYSISTFFGDEMNLFEILDFIIAEATFLHDNEFSKIQAGEEESTDFINYRSFYHDKVKIESSYKKIVKHISRSSVFYLGANPSKQSALFAIRDRNNSLSQAIHEYKQLGIDKDHGCSAYVFTKKWMAFEEFEIGDDLEITMYAGEAYEVQIKANESWIPLADKGMGSIQAMLLILRLACIIHKTEKSQSNITVIIEEPELNLHPALQSKLADLFLEVIMRYGIELIVETHSEYLIRKTQLLVKEYEFEIKPNENPFCVIYFDKEKQWKMNYREDGKFIDEFGTGFFDETRKIVKKMM